MFSDDHYDHNHNEDIYDNINYSTNDYRFNQNNDKDHTSKIISSKYFDLFDETHNCKTNQPSSNIEFDNFFGKKNFDTKKLINPHISTQNQTYNGPDTYKNTNLTYPNILSQNQTYNNANKNTNKVNSNLVSVTELRN